MAKYIYLLVFDTGRDWKDPKSCSFLRHNIGSDLAGHITAKAHLNQTTPDNIRMFVYDSKRIWEEAQRDWVRGVDWSLPCV